MAVVTWQPCRAALCDLLTLSLTVVNGALRFPYRLNSTWLVLGGGLAGWLVAAFK